MKPTCGLTSLPELSPSSMSKHLEALMETASQEDLLHDVIFEVGTKLYPAHMFIVASSSEHLYKLYQDHITTPGVKPTILLENVHPEVFDRILRFMYTGTCDVAELGPCNLKIRKEDLNMGKREKDSNIDVAVDLDLSENTSEISAFEVYKNEKNKKNRGRKHLTGGLANDAGPRHLYCDPVKLVQAAAKRLQVRKLHKLLDKFYYKDGIICLKDSATYAKNPPPYWERSNYHELVDTNVCSKDNVLIPAHKCILAAKLEYFQGMFMHAWTESKLISKVTLPINHGILQPVMDFLYTDSCPEVETSDSIDFICSMLVVADQLFITRLREMCEVTLAGLVNLKNCTELCQFAHTYNATQLKQCCMEFISLNICAILENKALDLLEETLLEDITNYYCKFNPIMSSRIITPFYNAPSDEIIEDFARNYPVDLDYTDEKLKEDDSLIEVSKKKRVSKKVEYTESEKARMRYETVSSVNFLDLSNETTEDITLSLSKIGKEEKVKEKNKMIEVPSSQQQKQQKIQARLQAILLAKDILTETPSESFTRLTKNNSSSSIGDYIPTSSRMSVSPKDSPLAELARSPQGNFIICHVGPKLSQKQRKRLVSQGECAPNLDACLENKLNIGSPPDKPKNPWKIVEPPIATSSPKSKEIAFNKILADQKKQKDDSSRIMTKPLALTQLEDKAIKELERFYNIHAVDDEWITVNRIELTMSSPQWMHMHTAPK